MKNFLWIVSLLMTVLFLQSCASTGYNTQKGAAIGAGLGAIAGQVIGSNTASTLIGTAVGALAGTIAGNALDQQVMNEKMVAAKDYKPAYACPDGTENPPGKWVEVPGQWVNGRWVPAHKVWMPVNP
ncbi:MAG TPA: glycine zipper domain-containing protein [Syntrophorhabdaceae bacterium]|nr:glycine zipper domain-containing protein [Syntrophorhabdaceae bacterium]